MIDAYENQVRILTQKIEEAKKKRADENARFTASGCLDREIEEMETMRLDCDLTAKALKARIRDVTRDDLRDYLAVKDRRNRLLRKRDAIVLRRDEEEPAESEEYKAIVEEIKSLDDRMGKIKLYVERCEQKDEYIGLMIRQHYLLGRTWTAVAVYAGGGNSEGSVRRMCHRFIDNTP